NTFENLRDDIERALLPLGNKLLESILPAIEKLSPKILGLLEDFNKLSDGTKTLVIGFGAAALAAGPVATAIGNITKAVIALNAAGTGVGLANLGRLGLIGGIVIGAPLAADAFENLMGFRAPTPGALRTPAEMEAIRLRNAGLEKAPNGRLRQFNPFTTS